jgi:hypothetical protein
MKYSTPFTLAIAVTFSFASSSESIGGTVASETQLGPHSAQKFTMMKHLTSRRSIDPVLQTSIALVLTVEQTMIGKQ